MATYTSEMFMNAYKQYAFEWAEGFLKEAYEQAKMFPETAAYSKPIYASKKIIDEIYENLNRMVTREITIEQEWRNTPEGDVRATFKVMW